MPNSNMNILNALASLKRADKAAFDKLMEKYNLDRWSDAKEADANAIIMECHAHTSGISLSDAESATELGDTEDADAEQPSEDADPTISQESNPFVPKKKGSARDQFTAAGLDNNARMTAKAGDADKPDLADVAGEHKTVAGKLDAMGRFANAARKVKGNA